MFILIVIILILLIVFYFRHRKKLVIPCVYMITGAPKTGKSWLSVCLAIKLYKKNLFRWKIRKLFGIKEEKPLLYSNIPLKHIEYVPLTKELILRQERFTYKSVVYVCEASLLADSMNYKDQAVNDILTLFNKLIGHETKGGYLIYDTQNLFDVHYAIKRVASQFLYIHHTNKILPFFGIMKVREMFHIDGFENVSAEDVEKQILNLPIRKKWWKYYDCYAYSSLTDDLKVNVNVVKLDKKDSLKANDIVRLRKFKGIDD